VGAKSGIYWVTWANVHAVASSSTNDLVEPFRGSVTAFVNALTAATAKVDITETRRSDKRAYLFHWCWLVGLGQKKASEVPPKIGVDIQWDHGDDAKSKQGAKDMIAGFGLAVPPVSTVAPATMSNHIAGKAVDMKIKWTGTITVAKKVGGTESIVFMPNVNLNTKLHAVGASYGVKKLVTDAPHWSFNGH
jgi:hypothetical protein